jgi:serine/threonine protein kinase
MASKGSKSIPARIGAYRILELIDTGGMGSVYKGLDPATNSVVAVKVIPEEVVADEVLRLRFAQECQVVRSVNHPHCVRVIDFGLEGSSAYMVLEYVDGESLGARLERDGRLSEEEAVRLVGQVGQALHYLHQRRVIHRDIKPDNILLTADGQAKLTDLGLAKNLDGDFNLTVTQSALGTPNFMAPEQFEDAKRADARSDLYALAATLYMLVTGELPFRARSVRAVGMIYKKKLAHAITPPRQLVPELSERLETEILKALQPDRQARHASVAEFLAGLSPPTAEESTPSSSAEVRRIEERFEAQCETSCHPLQRSPDKRWVGQVLNISRHGFCLKLDRRFEPGVLLRVSLEGKDIRRHSVVARVVWVRPEKPAGWRLGCRFDQPLGKAELDGLRQ